MDWIEFYGPNFSLKAIYSYHDGLAGGVQCLLFLVDYSMVLNNGKLAFSSPYSEHLETSGDIDSCDYGRELMVRDAAIARRYQTHISYSQAERPCSF